MSRLATVAIVLALLLGGCVGSDDPDPVMPGLLPRDTVSNAYKIESFSPQPLVSACVDLANAEGRLRSLATPPDAAMQTFFHGDSHQVLNGWYRLPEDWVVAGVLDDLADAITACEHVYAAEDGPALDQFEPLSDLPDGAVGYTGSDARGTEDDHDHLFTRIWVPVDEYVVVVGVEGTAAEMPGPDPRDLLADAIDAVRSMDES